MATTFITGIEVRPGRSPVATARDSIAYIENPEKTRNGKLVSSFQCSPESAYFEMMETQQEFERRTGRKVVQDYGGKKKSYILMTMRQSFAPGEVTPEEAHKIGCEMARKFLRGKYQYVVATHIDKHCIHNHITFNIIGSDFKKYHQTKYTPRHLRELSDKLCEEHGLSVVVPSEWQKRRYTNERVTSYRTILKNDIDQCIAAAQSYGDFLNRMKEMYYIDDTGKYLRFRSRTNGQQRMIRSYTLGKGYSRKEIQRRTAKEEELDNPLTYTQKLRNIEAMIHAVGYIRKNGSDFESQFQKIREAMEKTQDALDSARKQLEKAEAVSECLDTVSRYQPVYDRYRSTEVPEQYRQEHQDEYELYLSARKLLKENRIAPDKREAFCSELKSIRRDYDALLAKYNALQKQLHLGQKARDVTERVDADDQIIAGKRGKQYSRGQSR